MQIQLLQLLAALTALLAADALRALSSGLRTTPRQSRLSGESACSLQRRESALPSAASATALRGSLFDVVPLPVAVLAATGLIFGLFNVPENNIDLTDQGLAQARLARRKAKLDRGEQLPDTSGLDPYRYKFFEEDLGDDGDLDVIMGKKKGGGGCG